MIHSYCVLWARRITSHQEPLWVIYPEQDKSWQKLRKMQTSWDRIITLWNSSGTCLTLFPYAAEFLIWKDFQVDDFFYSILMPNLLLYSPPPYRSYFQVHADALHCTNLLYKLMWEAQRNIYFNLFLFNFGFNCILF